MTDNSLIFSVMTQGCHNYNRDILTSQKYWNILNSLDKLWIGTKLTNLNELLLIRRLREGWWWMLSCCLVRHSVTISTPFPTWRLPEIWAVITRSDDTRGPFLGRNRIEAGLVGRLRSYIVSHSHGLKLTSRGVKVAARIIAPLTFGDCNSILWFSVHCPIVCSSGARTLSEYVVL